MKYEELRPAQINKIIESCPIAYLVWGSHEWHGVHNPVGLDTLKAYYMTLELCKETGGVVLPPVYCGYQTMKVWQGFGHTFEFSKNLVRQYLYEHLENLYEEGFRVLVVVMGHYGGKHVEAIRAGVADFTEKHDYPGVLAITDYEPASWIEVKGGDHAGRNETSLMMHFRPELVDTGEHSHAHEAEIRATRRPAVRCCRVAGRPDTHAVLQLEHGLPSLHARTG